MNERNIEPSWPLNLLTAVCLSALLAGCGGGDEEEVAGMSTPANNQRVSGVLVAPESSATAAAEVAPVLSSKETALQAVSPTCVGIPAGYVPVANATIYLTDSAAAAAIAAAGTASAAAAAAASGVTVTTDPCGKFDAASVPPTVTRVSVSPTSAYSSISVPVSTLADRNGDGVIDPVSTFPAGARLEIVSAIVFGGKLTFIVRDSVTGKAVLGIPSSAIAVSGPAGALALTQFAYTASAGPASISLVLDASGSMSSSAATGSLLNRYQVAGAAAKLFVDRIGVADKVGTTVFDNTADFLNAEFFTTTWTGRIVDAAGQPVPLGLTTEGFTSDKTTLNRLADFYNRQSDSWRLTTAPVRFTGRAYPWGGSTALWDAVSLGVDKVVAQSGRQFVVAMTDGADNASRTTVAALTTKAVAAKVPVFTVAIGSATSLNTTNLLSLATATGGGFTLVDDADVQTKLAGAFDSIRTGIQFQYGGVLGSPVAAGTSLRVAVDYAGLRTEATLLTN